MRIVLTAFACTVSLAACGGRDAAPGDTATGGAAPPPATTTPPPGGESGAAGGAATRATATMRDSAGRELGTLTLADSTGGIAVAGTLRGLPPGEHAIHVHTTGRCEPPFESAGGHWNPTDRQHGRENPQGPHFGDMPNITVGADSSVTVQVATSGGTLRGENALLDGDGAAVMVHAQRDDYRTDPTGNAGGRIACGVVSGS